MDQDTQKEIPVNQPNSPSVLPVNNQVPQNPVPEVKPSNKVNKKVILSVLGISLLIGILFSIVYFFYPQTINKVAQKLNTSLGGEVNQGDISNYWISCSDVREVIEEEGKLYVGCLGGVLIVDEKSGQVLEQITQVNGLGNAVVTSLVKNNNILYIGTQDGVTEFDLSTKTAKKISVKEGLVNGANIVLEDDGDNLWVGTFNGVSLYNKKTGKITNFTKEMDPNSTNHNVNEILATDKSVYFIVLASAYSNGAVVRFDKATNKWETFGPQIFGETGQYARIDFYHLTDFDNKIYVGSSHDYWVSEDKVGSTWDKLVGPIEAIKNDQSEESPVIALLGSDAKGQIMSAGNGLYRYVPSTNKIEVILPHKEGATSVSFIKLNGKNLWGRSNSDGSWLTKINLSTNEVSKVTLKDWPPAFSKLLALIDEEPIFISSGKLWKFSMETKGFKQISNIANFSVLSEMFPINGTPNFLIFGQECGQGCPEPKFFLVNYDSLDVKELIIPSNILDSLKTEILPGFDSYNYVKLSWQDADKGLFGFNIDKDKYLILDPMLSKWEVVNSLPSNGQLVFDTNGTSKCNYSFTFAANENKFDGLSCSNKVENENYTWELKFDTQGIVETNKSNNQTTTLTPPSTSPDYSPFDTVAKYQASKIMYADGYLWVSSERGLSSYNPSSKEWKLYDVSKGLLRNVISDVLVGKEYLWVIAEWGGLSVIKK